MPFVYDPFMSTIAASAAIKSFATVLETAQREAVFIERRGGTAAVIISVEEYDRLMDEAEETAYVGTFDAAMAEEGPNIPWDQVETDLG